MVLVATCMVGVCVAEPHVISEDEWNTTARNLAAGDDPRQSLEEPARTEPAAGIPWLAYCVAGASGLIAGGMFCLWWLKRAKR